MSDEILKDLNRVIEKYKDKVFCTGELNYVDMAKSCKLEIERLNNIMTELETELYTKYHEHKDSECEELYARAQEDKEILDYIKELKVNK